MLFWGQPNAPLDYSGYITFLTEPLHSQEGWCDSQCTLEEVRAKLQMRQEGAIKRERAISYALSQRKTRPTLHGGSAQAMLNLKHHDFDKKNGSWSWLERWMAAKPWETRLMEQPPQTNHSEVQSFKTCEDSYCIGSRYSEPGLVQIKKNHVTTRVSAKPPPVLDNHRCRARSTSSPSTELHRDQSSPSSSSIYASTPISGTTILTSERTDDSNRSNPNYMNLTESTKAKQRACNIHRPTIQRLSSREVPFHSRKALSNIDSKSSLSSHASVFSSKLLNAMGQGNEKAIGHMKKEN